jgi:hypothetical protein
MELEKNLFGKAMQVEESEEKTISSPCTVGKYQHYLHGSGLLGSEKQWLYRIHMLQK